MKRSVIRILTIIMCLALIPISAFATEGGSVDNTLTLQVGKVEGAAGETVTVPIYIEMTLATPTTSLETIEFDLAFNQAEVTCNGAVMDGSSYSSEVFGSDLNAQDNVMDGVYYFAGLSLNGIVKNGILLELEFVMIADGASELAITNISASFYDTDTAVQSRMDLEDIASIDDPVIPAGDPVIGTAVEDIPESEPADDSGSDVTAPDSGDDTQESTPEDPTEPSSTDWILWMVCGIALLAVIAGVIFAVTKNRKKEQK
ncbi:MAG: cohesin domain-containing protein [Clostridia bacterium]|nr:cohesin domain-containing protein [Clostridia bacterium]